MNHQLTFGSLFAGIGGIDLGLEKSGMVCKWQVEIDPFCQQVLAARWPHIPKFTDIKGVSSNDLSPVDVLAGGFPCQDLSHAHTAGVRQGLRGPKSSLWGEYYRIIGETQPKWVVVENVNTWRDWVPAVRADLARDGYASLPIRLFAGSFGATHRRPRVLVVAHSNGDSKSVLQIHEKTRQHRPLPRRSDWPQIESHVVGVADGIPGRTHRLRALGNAVVPQVAEFIGSCIVEIEGHR